MRTDFQSVGIAGFRTAYRVVGASHARREPAVLVHGVGLSSAAWAPQVEALRGERRVVVYDTLGHGLSDLPPPGAGLEAWVDQLRGLLDALGIERAVVVGHSMGALVATAFAASSPSRVAALVALNAVYERSEESRRATLERADRLDREGPAATIEPTLARWFGDAPGPGHAAGADTLRRMLATADPVGYARAYRVFATADADLAGRLGALSMPALFMTAELDPNSTPAMSERMAGEAPDGRAVVLPGERHMAPFVSPQAVNAHLLAFFDEVDARASPQTARG